MLEEHTNNIVLSIFSGNMKGRPIPATYESLQIGAQFHEAFFALPFKLGSAPRGSSRSTKSMSPSLVAQESGKPYQPQEAAETALVRVWMIVQRHIP
jgi:hypothetical protein